MQACIFDLDGTLLDSLEDLADSCNATLEHAGYPTHDVATYRYFVGNGIDMMVRRALPEGEADRLGKEAFAALVDYDRQVYGAHWATKSRPYPGILDVLHTLAGKGVKLGLLSNKPHAWTVDIMAHFFGQVPFAVVRGAQAGVPHKPDPTAALLVAQELGLAPSACYYVGDSMVDMQTAVNAGMEPVGVTWGFRDEEELLTNGARHLAHKSADLLQLTFA